jgi:hypothetical protein
MSRLNSAYVCAMLLNNFSCDVFVCFDNDDITTIISYPIMSDLFLVSAILSILSVLYYSSFSQYTYNIKRRLFLYMPRVISISNCEILKRQSSRLNYCDRDHVETLCVYISEKVPSFGVHYL